MYNSRTKLSPLAVNLFQSLQSVGKNVFTRTEASDILNVNRRYLNNTLSSLEKEGWIKRLERGKYLIVPMEAGKEGSWSEHPYVIASYLVEPYCIAYWSALSQWGYTEQLLKTTFVLTSGRKFSAEKQVLGQTYKFISVKKEKLFGLTQVWVENRRINVTDREKTIVDCLDRPDYCGGIVEASKAIKNGLTDKKVSTEKILDYASRLGNRTVFKRLGYLAEILEMNIPDFESECLRRISKGYSHLDPTQRGKGRHLRKWMLIENVNRNELRFD